MSLDDHCITTLILCDISKAFDQVWHTGLLLVISTSLGRFMLENTIALVF
jgi:hypothetical protein